MTCWGFQADASQLGFEKLRQREITLSAATEPQLVVEVFSFKDQAKLVKGNLHMRIPTHTISDKKKLVTEALHQLEAIAKQEQQRHNGASQPIVCVLLGDTNLNTAGGIEAAQPLQPTIHRSWDNVWQIFGTAAERGGDICFVKGANASLFEIPVGASYQYRGVRNDNHDAFGVELRCYGSKPVACLKRKEGPVRLSSSRVQKQRLL